MRVDFEKNRESIERADREGNLDWAKDESSLEEFCQQYNSVFLPVSTLNYTKSLFDGIDVVDVESAGEIELET